ncbi:MAG: universal stress protein [Methylotenera sp.]|nr:universal stress protein [Methylotenera sp.]
MTAFKQLLVATDFSALAQHAVNRGFMLAKNNDAQYAIMHVLSHDAMTQLIELVSDNTSQLPQQMLNEAQQALTSITTDAHNNMGVKATTHVAEGVTFSELAKYSKAIDADLVLLGAHGTGYLMRYLIGSTSSRLLRKSNTHVLVVKNPPQKHYQRILVAVDLSPISEQVVMNAIKIAPQAEIVLLHVFNVPYAGKMQLAGVDTHVIQHYKDKTKADAISQLHALAKSAGLSKQNYIVSALDGDVTEWVVSVEQSSKCDLIVIGKHGKHVTEELLLGSATKKVLAETNSDVLVVVDQQPIQ